MTEDNLQIQVANYLRMQYPKVLWCHTPNGGSRNAIEGAKLKRMGVRAGMPDIMVYEDRHPFNGLAIELKVGKNKPTENQVFVLNELTRNRWQTAVCYSIDEAIKEIDKYLKPNL